VTIPHRAIDTIQCSMRYRFEDCTLDTERFELRRDGTAVHVEPQVFDVLAYLVAHRDRVVTKAELLDAVWGDRFVSESALSSRLKSARRAVGDDGSSQRVIRTAFGRGYQFVADVVEVAAAPMTIPEPLAQTIRSCRAADGTRLAYATIGSGPSLVKAANWMTHLDHDAHSIVWRHWLDGLAAGRTLVRYDERGCGMSDHDVELFAFDDWVDDLRAVVDAVDLDCFPLLGISQGAAVAVAFASRFPERVSRLVLVSGYARGRLARATSDAERELAAVDLELARVGWGRDDPSFRNVFTAQFLPDGNRAEWDAFDELQRRTVSADNAARFIETFARIDITGAAPQVRCPTLVVHARNDLRQPIANGRELAALIPDSRLVVLPSRNHLLTSHEPAWPMFLAELTAFLDN
jgi:DNA-binding winged helix-turn-helix (wHTH) protein/pimeloyl-ACP methyl ester carboxylesterase